MCSVKKWENLTFANWRQPIDTNDDDDDDDDGNGGWLHEIDNINKSNQKVSEWRRESEREKASARPR